ncbi:hypothetical protein DSO57_1021597 [Entomophthora muscae]|uniref:Uncharacterized protein n=1 Tax=Entomophthora muscae TaxID=34485 RepID=A0ACC2UCS4_9FUNG|nr:hypothetical protein DSO57_1021597 [Entomophthora muscae]
MFASFGSRSRNKSGTPKSRGVSTIGPEDVDQLRNDTSHLNGSRLQVMSVADERTPPAKRPRIADASDKTGNEIATNPLYLELKAKFPIQMLAWNQTTEMSDLILYMDSLDKGHQSKIHELELAAAKKQEIIVKQKRDIEDLGKSLLYLTAREKKNEDRDQKPRERKF